MRLISRSRYTEACPFGEVRSGENLGPEIKVCVEIQEAWVVLLSVDVLWSPMLSDVLTHKSNFWVTSTRKLEIYFGNWRNP